MNTPVYLQCCGSGCLTEIHVMGCRSSEKTHVALGSVERAAFVKSLMRLIERGQYSKNSSLTSTVGSSACLLAFVEPSLMLPYIVSTFDTALDSVSLRRISSSLSFVDFYFSSLLSPHKLLI